MKIWLKKYKKTLYVFLLILAIPCIYAGYVTTLIFSSYREVPPAHQEVLIILGAKVNGEAPAQPSKALQERLDTAYLYLTENEETIVIVTGGQGKDESEPEGVVMARYLENKGIDSARIIIEQRSTSTLENISMAMDLYDFDTVIIVSNDYHIYRAKLMAYSLGLKEVYGLAAPSTTAVTFTSYLREILALGYHLLFTI